MKSILPIEIMLSLMGASSASGMTVRQALKAYDIGSQALNAADYAALGGKTTTALEKAAIIRAGYEITTTPARRLWESIKLAPTGLTPSGEIFVGAASSYAAFGRAGNHETAK